MLLEEKNAVVYGAGGAVGGAVARAFAREGANVFLAGRTIAELDALAEEITAAGERRTRLGSTRWRSRPSSSMPRL
jgi:NAD(P)-dependent dehydrogenase (short-subunit alcohol dehydrogenase family)